ncbi:MAG: helicase-related protein [Geminicoccaceae bacterium]|nr:helicase-related protein [Geminicoccaceae bacterium]
MLLSDRDWPEAYTPEAGDLVRLFWIPALACAVRYDRAAGYFSARALALAARGLEGLLRNEGRMRLLVGCTLEPPEIEAILRGQELRAVVAERMLARPIAPGDEAEEKALELLAWMVARGTLDVKVAVPCDEGRRPLAGVELFHAKFGILEDKTGDRIGFNGSINETAEAWRGHFESFHVYTSWGPSRAHLEHDERRFAELWEDRARTAITLDLPEAVRAGLLRFAPREGTLPHRLVEPPERCEAATEPSADARLRGCAEDRVPFEHAEPHFRAARDLVWSYIAHAPSMPGGEWLGVATSVVRPWPHQIRAFRRMWEHWPPRLLIADEVGLGKTIQAGMILRQAWLSGRAKRILIIAPSAVLRQWQLELREKFNLAWPIYDGEKLCWPAAPGIAERERKVARDAWHREPCLIVSAHLVRRRERARELLAAEPFDLLVVDEAHHARRKGAGGPLEEGPNRLLQLLRELAPKTPGLVLLTATPMQIHPVEVWDLLSLLGLPPECDAAAFEAYYRALGERTLSNEALDRAARLFQALERHFGSLGEDEAQRAVARTGLGLGPIGVRKLLRALRDSASTPRRMLDEAERRAAKAILAAGGPVGRLVSRNTRALLRAYRAQGRLRQTIAQRKVEDRFVALSTAERSVYDAVEAYIKEVWDRVKGPERTAVGFVLTVYRRRLASSFAALSRTLEQRLRGVARLAEEDRAEAEEEELEPEAIDAVEREAALFEEQAAIERLLLRIGSLRGESKAERLAELLEELAPLGQVMVFTQYTDTLDFLRDFLAPRIGGGILCFSGRGGEMREADGGWRAIDRDRVKALFAEGAARVLLCTDAAAEGLNFQFCGALVNYDLPWNPMRVEQRIGRIDRLGQRYETIRVVNLFVADTVETEVYLALRERVRLFEGVVGPLQPILARLPRRLEEAVLSGREAARDLVATIRKEAAELEREAVDPLAAAEGGIEETRLPKAPYELADLARLLARPDLLPAGWKSLPAGAEDRLLLPPGAREPIRVTADPDFFDLHAESCELFAPGSPIFPEVRPPLPPPDRAQFERLLERAPRPPSS